jgi:hypothetical protein
MGQGQRTLQLFGAHEWLGCLLWVDQGGRIVCWFPKVVHLRLLKQRVLGGPPTYDMLFGGNLSVQQATGAPRGGGAEQPGR